VYRPGIVQPPAARTPAIVAPPAASTRTYSNRGFASGRGRGMQTAGPSSAPPVIYYRGTPVPPGAQQSPANAYERAGVAVPRNLPGSTGSSRSVMPGGDAGRGNTTPPQYRGPTGSSQGSGDGSPRSGGRISAPGAAPRSGVPSAVPRASGSLSGPGFSGVPAAPRSAPMGSMGPPPGMSAPAMRSAPPPARSGSASPGAAPSQAGPRSGGSSRR
jgi:hypothetical protein